MHHLLRISGTLGLRRSNRILQLIFKYRPNEDPHQVHAVELILKDIIDVCIVIKSEFLYSMVSPTTLRRSYFNSIRKEN